MKKLFRNFAVGLAALSIFLIAADFGVAQQAPPLPPSEARLRTIRAHLWLKVSDDPSAALEGPAFDREGNLYFVKAWQGTVLKVAANSKTLTEIYNDNGASVFVCCDIHKDGRLFLTDIQNGRIVSMNPDGTGLTVIATDLPGADDIIFDMNGNFIAVCSTVATKTPSVKLSVSLHPIIQSATLSLMGMLWLMESLWDQMTTTYTPRSLPAIL